MTSRRPSPSNSPDAPHDSPACNAFESEHALDHLRKNRRQRLQRSMRQLIADSRRRPCAPRHASRAVCNALCGFLKHRGFLFLREVGFENDNHIIGMSPTVLRAQKNRRDDLRQIGGLGALTRPQAPVRRIGKIIPTGKAAKLLAKRIHETSVITPRRASRRQGAQEFPPGLGLRRPSAALESAPLGILNL